MGALLHKNKIVLGSGHGMVYSHLHHGGPGFAKLETQFENH